jgi:hypothetical protein
MHPKGWVGNFRKEISLTRLFEPAVFLPPITEHCRDQLKKNITTVRHAKNISSEIDDIIIENPQ